MSKFLTKEQMYIMIQEAETIKSRLDSLHTNYDYSNEQRNEKLNSIVFDVKSLYPNIITKSTTL